MPFPPRGQLRNYINKAEIDRPRPSTSSGRTGQWSDPLLVNWSNHRFEIVILGSEQGQLNTRVGGVALVGKSGIQGLPVRVSPHGYL